MVGAGVCIALAVVSGIAAGLTGGRGTVGVLAFGLASLVFIGYFFLSGRDFTTCDEAGLKCRALGKYRAWSWSEIASIDVRTYSVRGVPRSVVSVTLQTGDAVSLTVPIHGGATKDPIFANKAQQIQQFWRTCTVVDG
jgi:hypothetical protein